MRSHGILSTQEKNKLLDRFSVTKRGVSVEDLSLCDTFKQDYCN